MRRLSGVHQKSNRPIPASRVVVEPSEAERASIEPSLVPNVFFKYTIRRPSGDHFGPRNWYFLSSSISGRGSSPLGPASQYFSSFQKAMCDPSGEKVQLTLSLLSLRTSPDNVEMSQRAICGLVPASPSARILVPSRDHEKRAQRKQNSGGTESVRVSPVSMRRIRIAVESL